MAFSPLGWARPWRPAGDIDSGKEILRPRDVVEVSTFETSTRTRGRRRYLE